MAKGYLFQIKGCPKCGGTVVSEHEEDPICLCCGWVNINVPQFIVDEIEQDGRRLSSK